MEYNCERGIKLDKKCKMLVALNFFHVNVSGELPISTHTYLSMTNTCLYSAL